MLEMRHAVIAHKNCPDGAACVLFADVVRPGIRALQQNHIQINQAVLDCAREMEPGGRLWIADICCDRNIMEEACALMRSKHCVIEVYEHHVTREWLVDFARDRQELELYFDLNDCASRIFFNHHLPGTSQLSPYDRFSRAIRDRDLWLNQMPEGKILARLHDIYEDQGFIERFRTNPALEWTSREELLMRYMDRKEERRIQALLDSMKIATDPRGLRYGVIFGGGAGSDLLDRALDEMELEYAFLANLNAGRASVRSRGRFNCAEYAVQRGGGGHRCAAGFPIGVERPNFP